jgi:hypothetical protein
MAPVKVPNRARRPGPPNGSSLMVDPMPKTIRQWTEVLDHGNIM